jgi:hypothetical protein
MKLYYANRLIGGDSPLRDIAQNFLPSGACNVQWLEGLRRNDAVPVARGNRRRTVSFRLTFAPELTAGRALAKLSDWFDDLPDEAALRWEESGVVREAGVAVLQDYKAAGRPGVTGMVDVTFAISRPVILGEYWTDEAGDAITDEAGANIQFANID